jgi:RimJ/RimL family protein N-acetyltransferase
MAIIELPAHSFPILPALFSQSEQRLVIRSIAAGHNPAHAWVDRLDQPSAAMVWDKMGGLYLAGKPAHTRFVQDLRDLLNDTIVPDARERWIPEMEIFFDQPGWEPFLYQMLPEDLQPSKALFNSYCLARPQAHLELLCLPAFTVARVNHDLLAQHSLDHMENLTGWILSFYHTLDAFLKTGFGYVAISESDQAIASLCITVFVAPSETGSGKDYELGLATASEYRRRGLAGVVAAACLRHCLEAGDTPVWHCWADNRASASLAEKVGYDLLRQTPAIRFNTGI